jgi:triphosphatase
MQRLEHEVPLQAGRGLPVPDLSLHAGTAAGGALLQALAGAEAALEERFSTDIRRSRRRVRSAGGGLVEVALDEGTIRAGAVKLPVLELEFELLRGPASALPALATRWTQRHRLWLDVRSKAERGGRLASGQALPPASKSVQPALRPGMDGGGALRAMLASALDQVLANACELADAGATPEHLHQCRIGIRRMRCILRDFAGLAGEPVPVAFAGWQDQLRELFRRLGAARDRDALCEALLPGLAAAGAPPLALPRPAADEEEPGALLREPASNRLWLEILGFIHSTAQEDGAAVSLLPLRDRLRQPIRRLHRQIVADAGRYRELDEAGQHRVRKRLKRLRYGVELCSSLFAARRVSRYLALLRPAQDALGARNDLLVARALFGAQSSAAPGTWFALGWLAGREPAVLDECSASLAAVAAAPVFWRREHDR